MDKRICSVDGCERTDRITRGKCNKHYEYFRRTGRDSYLGPSVDERFWVKVDKDGPISEMSGLGKCWLWTAGTDAAGYGSFGLSEMVRTSAHRYAYKTLVGPIPEGLELDHLCRVRSCCNPAHLEPVTRQVNQLRGETIGARNAAVTHCPQGHPYDAENTYVHAVTGYRKCRTCIRAIRHRWDATKRAT